MSTTTVFKIAARWLGFTAIAVMLTGAVAGCSSGGDAGTPSASAVTSAVHEPGSRVARNGRWIAYSTAPSSQSGWSYGRPGSDVFMTRAGDQPKLVASRGSGDIWNICPAFSQDGRMLAFAELRRAVRRSSSSALHVTARSAHQGPF